MHLAIVMRFCKWRWWYIVLQCVAVCCRVLQCVAVFRSVLPCFAVCCSVLQCAAVCCISVDRWRTHCNALNTLHKCTTLHHTATHCNTLQHTADKRWYTWCWRYTNRNTDTNILCLHFPPKSRTFAYIYTLISHICICFIVATLQCWDSIANTGCYVREVTDIEAHIDTYRNT